MKRETYRAMTFGCLALTVLNVTQKASIASLFDDLLYDHVNYVRHPEVGDAFRNNWGITIFAVATIAFAYFWLTSKNSN